MPYQTNPTFVDGSPLSAAQLNILSDNIEFLYGLISGVNIPFTGQSITDTMPALSREWNFRRYGRYLHYQVTLTTGDSDELDLRIKPEGGSYEQVFTDATNRSGGYQWVGYIDLDSMTVPPAVGDFYSAQWEIDFTGGAAGITIDWMVESEGTTL